MIIDGKQVAQNLRNNIKKQVENLDRKPGLAVVLVGDDPASSVYVNHKVKACKEVGFHSKKIELDEQTTFEDLCHEIDTLNADVKIDGILVQLPLPKHFSAQQINAIIARIDLNKDVDGFHTHNMGLLATNKTFLSPCTPKGVMTLLQSIDYDVVGKDCVVVGASNIVGRPMALELLNARATVTICNSKTQNLAEKIKNADVVVVGIGKPAFIKGEWIKEGAVVIDVGINRLETGKLVGDVAFDDAKDKASFITPVPGGVGPMTIATLLENTLIAYNHTENSRRNDKEFYKKYNKEES
jgi:methylenetetrahydrofolate dehydrogenase (NADP+)/methenyltetrahydrofolate cyclohydrolase